LQALSGAKIDPVAYIPGGGGLEKHVHARLAAHRVHGEWFRDARHVRTFIEWPWLDCATPSTAPNATRTAAWSTPAPPP
jgi:hypothetical protein